MEGQTNFILDLILILVFTNIGGLIASKLKQPAVLGHILAGLLIGPAILNLVNQGEFISNFAEMGVILLMFMAGMETNIDEMKRSAGSSSAIAIGGMVLPFILGFLAVKLLFKQQGNTEAIFTGVILTATSISITVQALRELGKLRDKTGLNILGAAIIDDVAGIILLTIVTGIANPGEGNGPLFVIIKIVIYFIIALIAAKLINIFIPKYSYKLSKYITTSTLALICCLVFAYTASLFEIASIIGAYTAGLTFSIIPNNNRIEQELNTMCYIVFTPVFFANIGLGVSFENIASIILPVIVISVVAIIGKVIGSGFCAKLSKFTFRESLQIGIGMIPRGEVALIIASIGKNAGIIGPTIFTSIIIMTIVTTLITPILLKKAYGKINPSIV